MYTNQQDWIHHISRRKLKELYLLIMIKSYVIICYQVTGLHAVFCVGGGGKILSIYIMLWITYLNFTCFDLIVILRSVLQNTAALSVTTRCWNIIIMGIKYLNTYYTISLNHQKGWCDVDHQRTRFYFWGFLRLYQFWWKSIKKCDRESAHRRIHILTDRQTQTDFIPALRALHATRSNHANAVRPSICLSVCLSVCQTCDLWQNEKNLCPQY